MAEMADARAELDRWGGELHERVAELVAVCTPGAEVRPPAEPRVADWHEPVRYRHTLTVRATRDPAVAPATLAERAAAALAAAGWTVHREAPDGPDGPLIVSGTRPELALRVRFSTTSTVVLYTGETAAVPRGAPAGRGPPPPGPPPPPRPRRDIASQPKAGPRGGPPSATAAAGYPTNSGAGVAAPSASTAASARCARAPGNWRSPR
ncbi:hypothetical protein [Nocardia farcinica]|uniref:hypothetical protein n=1 Tax=Nocardia farcinica TaxID=37329 RepID=UPI002455BD34|nr:hypothetical protein [Nocardia farcinica]